MSSYFADIADTPPDAAFSLVAAFAADKFESKVDLCPGFYRDENAQPWAKQLLHDDPTLNHEHLPLSGHPDLIAGARSLVFGLPEADLSRVATIQTVSGTGSNHLGARFLSDELPAATVAAAAPEKARRQKKSVWISNLSWINHTEIWLNVNPDIARRTYPYYNPTTQSLDYAGMQHALLHDAAAGDVVVLHGCAHNPTGLDLSHDQWRGIADICEEKRLFPFFDLAYQGFATGSLAADAWPIRHFLSRPALEFCVAQSFSKNFGLYSERVGALHVVTRSAEIAARVSGKLKRLQRAEITTPPAFGARVVAKVLGDAALYKQWEEDLLRMSGRMKRMRERLYEELQARETPGEWEHVLSEIGMFSMTGLSPAQVKVLVEKYHVYLLPSGRISVTGLTEMNVAYVAEAFDKVLRSVDSTE
ncbi:Aspartate aminotransferase, cytoplasmic [Lasiodiplodia theobromae]|uniref:Aspartate aminotransferase, cytoplasmic n=1 Tax=Lasiodiplodia theobromae TaxID=45133 RepID=UPI0015C33A71|nr:Aspartate aminotransferase, cytoplasmic [Lasiodiplodia theobromae]KAF4536422.1 Aspartate aminotransferase, cytoplasmic [Lasiodiplodia theobromae]